MFLEGQIIEFLDADQLWMGYVRKQERDRLQVIDPRGRQLSVNSDRVAVVQQIVLAHGWEITCLGNAPRGALFRITHLKIVGG